MLLDTNLFEKIKIGEKMSKDLVKDRITELSC
jgi:hypothetical protein